MKLKRYAAWLPAVFLLCAAVPARADLMETVPFNLGVGPSQKTIELPQFNPALGTLTETFLLVNGSIQYVVDVFNNGAGPFSATVEDSLTFGTTPIPTGGTFSGSIPANQPVFAYSPTAILFGPLTEIFNGAAGAFLVGTGTVAFDLTLPAVKVDSFSGSTVTNVASFSAASGSVTADYIYTPAATAAPEPASWTMLGAGLLLLCARRRKVRT